MQPLGGQRMRIDQEHERREGRGAGAHPITDRRGAEMDALTRKGLAEPIERQVLAEFRLQNGGEEMRPRPARSAMSADLSAASAAWLAI